MRYFIIAGELSGDNYAQQLMQQLKQADPDPLFNYWGPTEDSAVMGFAEVASKLGKILALMKKCKKDLLDFSPDVLILIDYPGFNMKMAKFAHQNHIKVFYYIAPKVWASREGRIKKMKRYIDRLYVIFPFETDYFAKKGLQAVYLGNPLLDNVHHAAVQEISADDFRKQYNLPNKPIIALLPGSRRNEIQYLLPRVLALTNDPEFKDFQWIVAGASSMDGTFYDRLIGDLPVRVIFGNTYGILKHAQAALVSSGTATLETAFLNCPQVVCYGGSPLSVAIGRLIIKVSYISLPNLILNKKVVEELIQKECNAQNIKTHLLQLMEGRAFRRSQLANYKRLRRLMGDPGATRRIAYDMVDALNGDSIAPSYTFYTTTPFGNFCFACNESGIITAAHFEDNVLLSGCYMNGEPLQQGDTIPPVLLEAVSELNEYLKGSRRVFDLPLQIEGTNFQKQVWEQLLQIPYGTTLSYLQLAEKLGNPNAARAVGQANNANPFAILIPCHRVIGHDGTLVGYAGGVSRKQKLLAMEKSYAPELTNSLF